MSETPKQPDEQTPEEEALEAKEEAVEAREELVEAREELAEAKEELAEAKAASTDEVGRGDERSEAGPDEDEPVAEAAEDDTEDEDEDDEPAAAASTPAAPAPAPTTSADEVGRGGERSETVRRRDQRAPAPVGLEVTAKAKYVRTSARKARLVCDHIRGKDVAEARAILAFTPRAAAKPWAKLLESAVANAEHNHELIGEELKILSVHADEGPTLKRFQPRAHGRATRIRKRTSHLSITLTSKEA